MQIKLKTQEQLVKDGWQINRRSRNNFMFFGEEVRNDGLSRAFTSMALGRAGHIIDVRIPYDTNRDVTVDVIVNELKYRNVPYNVFEKFNVRKLGHKMHYVGQNKLKFNGYNFSFGCKSVTIAEAKEAAAFILKVTK